MIIYNYTEAVFCYLILIYLYFCFYRFVCFFILYVIIGESMSLARRF